MEETYKIYYDETTGLLCERYPANIARAGSSPFLEVGKEDYERTLQCEYGRAWAVKNGGLCLVEDAGVISSEEYISFVKSNELVSLKAYLAETDYVISKLNELKLEDEGEYEAERANYSDVLKRRKEARARINELEG